jgi:late competence protein required for DNA uptake (superfamily II DNA/RNA helicase)
MDYETYHTPSWDWEKSTSHYEGKRYECEYCGTSLDDHEVFLVSGKPYCGCCK